MVLASGEEFNHGPVFAGAEGRYEDYVYLRLLEREWKRPVPEMEQGPGGSDRYPSPPSPIVLLFWTYFETRIERLLRAGMRGALPAMIEDTLDRYSSIGSRLDRCYNVVFASTYKKDLKELGLDSIWAHLRVVQERRNAFVHGNPLAIDEALVVGVVEKLRDEHEAWIAVFNKRAARPPTVST